MPLLLLDGDTGSHGGVVTSSATKTYAEGSLVVLNGDAYACAIHGAQTINGPISIKTYAEGALIALDNATTTCGATITSSATKTYAE